jgi:O-methyltransferase
MRSVSNTWHRIRYQFVEAVAVWGDRYLYKHHVHWTRDHSWLEPYREVMRNDPTLRKPQTRKLDRRFTLIEFARSTRSLSGSTAECGVARGVGSGIILTALRGTYAPHERHYGFDAFAGLPAPTDADRQGSDAMLWAAGDLKHDQEQVEQLLAPFPEAELRVGWIPETFAGLENDTFRFVHIDVDLYQSTWDSLAFFYPRLVPGGIILLDDHGFLSCPGARAAALTFFQSTPEVVIDLTTGQGLVVKR